MGATQSSSASDNSSAQAAQVKISYYELLAVDRSATEDEIKKAYRRKALELHPDRNYGNVEESTALFAQVQSAYEVLSDPQERAWYDSHEHAILRDIDPAAASSDAAASEQALGLTSADDIMRMFRKFNGNVEFSDAPSGFFGFLRKTFDQLAEEERSAALRQGDDIPDFPSFGHEADHHDTIKNFYVMWAGFSTRKSFAWRDRYRTSDADDRWTRRQVEKENKAFRLEGKQEFNEAVRSLVAFVKKRDPRYSSNLQSEQQRQAALREATQAQAVRMRAANQAQLQQEVPEWTRSREPEEELMTTDEESEEEHFECVACRKIFKSENQFTTHEKSKKHQKAVFALRKKLKKEGISLDLDEDEDANDSVSTEEPRLQNRADEVSKPEDEQLKVESAELPILQTTAKVSLLDGDDDMDKRDSRKSSLDHAAYSQDETSDESSQQGSQQSAASLKTGKGSKSLFSSAPKLGKAAQKRAKRAAKQLSRDEELAGPHGCVGCGTAFPSKRQLFQHLKDHPRHVANKSEVHERIPTKQT